MGVVGTSFSQGNETKGTDDSEHLSTLICFDSVVAIMPSVNSLDDYYLLYTTSEGVVTLEKDTQSEYGIMYSKGSDVIFGHFYQYQRSTRDKCIYKMGKKQAIVHKDSVLYVGVEVSVNEKDPRLYILSCTDHEDILCAVSVRI